MARCSSESESKGITQKLKRFGDIHTKQGEGYRIRDWALSSYPEGEPGTDVHAITKEKRISITPIKVRLPHNKRELENLSRFLLE